MSVAPDPRIARLRREYFLMASEPLYRQMADIRLTFTQYRMIVDGDGRLIRDESTLPEFAQRWIATLEAGAEQCRQLAEAQEGLL